MNKQVIKIAHAVTVGICLVLGGILLFGQSISGHQNGNQNGNQQNGNGNRAGNGNMNGNMNSNMNSNRNANGNSNGNSNGNMNGNMNGNANSMPGRTLRADDRKFMMEAAMGGMAEVEMARLALERGSTDAVKQYAQHMLDDHTRSNNELMQIASMKGVALPTALDAKHTSMLERLRRLSGAEFDRAYLREGGVKAHTDMEKLFQREATRGMDADVKAFASKTLPVVREHLQRARAQASGGGNANSSTHGNMNMNSNRR